MGLIIISVVFAIIGGILSSRLRSKFAQYSEVPLSNGMSGAEIATLMLQQNNIYDVQVIHIDGQLTDHYNPQNKTVNLSQDVYHGRNVAAAAVAAHECGHAVQHATSYSMLKFRSAIVPVVSIAANVQQYLFMFGLATLSQFGSFMLIAALIVYAITTIFSLVTLPVEFDASRRAMLWLETSGIARGAQYEGAKDALFWAAMTYVAAAVAAVVQLLYLVLRFTNRR